MTQDPGRTLRPLLTQSSLREQVRNGLQSAIVAGDMKSGAVYSAPVLAQRFGVSVTPVREALLDLANEGMVEPVRNKGFRVCPLSEADLDEIYDLRSLVEIPAVRRLAGRIGPEAQEELAALAAAIESAAAEGDVVAYIDADRVFHLTLLGHVSNDRLVKVVSTLRSQARLFGLADLAEKGLLISSAREHRVLLDAVCSGRADDAEAIMRAHLGHTRGIWAAHPEPAARKAHGGATSA